MIQSRSRYWTRYQQLHFLYPASVSFCGAAPGRSFAVSRQLPSFVLPTTQIQIIYSSQAVHAPSFLLVLPSVLRPNPCCFSELEPPSLDFTIPQYWTVIFRYFSIANISFAYFFELSFLNSTN